ncbi:MAG: hypothetical protein JST90_14685 [Bacteroidetes bacterium]|nr:hypothetical protein [Bacteroidota bacterium]
MKLGINVIFSLVAILAASSGCGSDGSANIFARQPSVHVTVLWDLTGPMSARPQGEEVLGLLGIRNDHLYCGYTYRMRSLSSVNLTDVFEASIPPENSLTGDDIRRVAAIRRFKKAVQGKIDSAARQKSSDEPYSVLYATIAQELNQLANHPAADTKTCLIYSDLTENSQDGNYYSASELARITAKPENVIAALNRKVPLSDLHGLTVYLVYRPRSNADERRFSAIASMYRSMLERRGATVIIGSNIITH